MSRGGKRTGAGRPKGSSHLSSMQRLLVGLSCEREWHRRYYPRPKQESEYLRVYASYVQLRRAYRERWRKQQSRPRSTPLQLVFARKATEAAGGLLRSAQRRRLTAPNKGLKAEITAEQSRAAEARFGRPVSPRMVRSCWADFLAFKRRHPHKLDYLIDCQDCVVPILFSLPENRPRAYLGVRNSADQSDQAAPRR